MLVGPGGFHRLAHHDHNSGARHHCPRRPPRPPRRPFYEVSTGSVAGLGTVLVDGQGGHTLYVFEPDRPSGKSTLLRRVREPLAAAAAGGRVKAPLARAGVKPSLLGITVRTGGLEQVTYNGWPLYFWHNDSLSGNRAGAQHSGGAVVRAGLRWGSIDRFAIAKWA